MFDINFYMKIADIKRKMMMEERHDSTYVMEAFEAARSHRPYIYNLETTNACNMVCQMCPRTTLMTRDINSISPDLFARIADQIEPHSEETWKRWEAFAESHYNVGPNEMSENNFFLYVIPRVIVLHGYGEPLLDPNLGGYVKQLSARGIPSYFSCNPANINVDLTIEFFENGLDYIKYSIDTIDDIAHKEIRGNASNFSKAHEKILKILEIKKRQQLKTKIVITMINLGLENQAKEFAELKSYYEDQDVYIYLKSQDQQWYLDNPHETQSIHWSEFCQYPWSSMTVNCTGQVVKCPEDFNSETILGDLSSESLKDVWNGKLYANFREDHFLKETSSQCFERCDMCVAGDLASGTHQKKTTY
jgi:radical SAM protein with 4Fe4S-binding SPASM domain